MVDPRPRAPRLIRPVREPATVPPPLIGPWAPTDLRLDDVELLPLPPDAHGPEDVVVDPAGRVISGDEDGRLWRWPVDAPPGTRPRLLAETGGRPLGIELDRRDDSLVVCDAYRGLLRVTADGRVHQLTGTGSVHLANNATVAADGTVFFTDSSHRFPVSHWKHDLLEHRPNGRVLAYDPATRHTEVVTGGLYFPNGIALTPDESALMLVETTTHRLVRVALPDGGVTVLTDLPAYPDNLSAVGDGTYWIALPSPRLSAVERLLPYPRVRQLVAMLPDAVRPQPRRYGLVALVDGEGQVRRTLHGPGGSYWLVTGVRQHGDQLWLGSLIGSAVARVGLG